jgi:glycosyltransferase involved in cell wall biosynthesis
LVEWKNWHLLLDAFSTLEDADLARLHLDIWGPTPPDPAAQAYAARLHEQCRQPRLVNTVALRGATNEIHARFKESDWFVLPSTNEPCSVALIEALAHGVPVLTSASGGNVDIVKPEVTGVFFEPGSVEALAEQLKRIARNEIIVSPAEAIRNSVLDRSASRVAEAYAAIYRELRQTAR